MRSIPAVNLLSRDLSWSHYRFYVVFTLIVEMRLKLVALIVGSRLGKKEKKCIRCLKNCGDDYVYKASGYEL